MGDYEADVQISDCRKNESMGILQKYTVEVPILVINREAWECSEPFEKDVEVMHELSRMPFPCEVKPDTTTSSGDSSSTESHQQSDALVRHLLC